MNKKTIAVFFGGKSAEHDISIITAIANIIKPLEILGHKIVPVYITKSGQWISSNRLKNIATFQKGEIDKIIKKHKLVQVFFDGKLLINGFKIDLVFPAMHGTFGEDGSLAGMLRLANVPFVGCDMEASVVAMNKILSKIVAVQNNIATPKFLYFSREGFNNDPDSAVKKIEENLKYPLFVKPPHLGSSIGITKVDKKSDLRNALEVAAYYDTQILVEEGVNNLIEVTLPIIGNDKLTPALLERPLNRGEFFDFDTKYMNGGKKGKYGKVGGAKTGKLGAQGYSEIPAKIPEKLAKSAEELALTMYHSCGLTGIARIDMLIDEKTGVVYFNEINPLPGSLYAHNFARAGISNVELVKKLIELAEEKFAMDQKAKTTFDTSFLKQF